jgi:hypothetical protein
MKKTHYTDLQWAILILREDYGYTYRQITERLNCSMRLVVNVVEMSRFLDLKPLIIKDELVRRKSKGA